jgi:lipoprotein-anchoring transpeptidase ErfK/SrfK
MRRHLATATAALAAAAASLGLGAAVASAATSSSTATTTLNAASTTTTPPTTTPTTTTTTTTTSTTPTTTTTTTTTTTPAKPAPAPVKASGRLYLLDAFFVHGDAVTVPNRSLSLGGYVHPYVADQRVLVKAYVGRRLIKTERLRVKPASGGRSGRFTVRLSSPVAGIVRIAVVHQRTTRMLGFETQRRVAALNENVSFGARGEMVDLIQQQLAALHIYVLQSGVFDSFTGWALDAYHRLLSQGVAQTVDPATITALLNGEGAFVVKFPSHGTHAEGDLTHQLLALIKGSQVQYILPISSGKPSTPTILGDFQVYLRDPGYLSDGMYYSDFFTGGYAIHGYDPAPDYPASHGCMRLPIQDAIFVYNWLNYGDWVDTYYR